MQDYLPYSGFRWMTACELTEERIMKIAPDADEGCFVECTLDYPEALHDLHADYPLAPSRPRLPMTCCLPMPDFFVIATN